MQSNQAASSFHLLIDYKNLFPLFWFKCRLSSMISQSVVLKVEITLLLRYDGYLQFLLHLLSACLNCLKCHSQKSYHPYTIADSKPSDLTFSCISLFAIKLITISGIHQITNAKAMTAPLQRIAPVIIKIVRKIQITNLIIFHS